jgi:hypothetical protein
MLPATLRALGSPVNSAPGRQDATRKKGIEALAMSPGAGGLMFVVVLVLLH